MTEETPQEEGFGSLKFTIGVYSATIAVKLIGFAVTGIMVLLADALHSLSDIIIFSFLLAGAIWSRKGADEEHMFGHGRAQNAAALVAATIFISFTSLTLFEESISGLLSGAEPAYQAPLAGLVVIGIAMVLQSLPLVKLYLGEEEGAASKATFYEIFNDQASTIAALLGTLAIMRGMPIIDPFATLFIAGLIGFNGVRLLKENFSILMGESPGEDFIKKVRETALSVEGVEDVRDIKAEYVGSDKVHVGMNLKVDGDTPVRETDRIVEKVREEIHGAIGEEGKHCYIQVEGQKD